MRDRNDKPDSGPLITEVEEHHSAAPEKSEMTAFTTARHQRDSGVNHERAVAMASMYGAAGTPETEADDHLKEIEAAALGQGDYRAAECEVETATRVAEELPKTKLGEKTVETLLEHATEMRKTAKKIKRVKLKPARKKRKQKAEAYAALPWLAKQGRSALVALCLLGLALAAFDIGVIKTVFAFVPMKQFEMWVIALSLGIVMSFALSALWGPLAGLLGSPRDDEFIRPSPPGRGLLLAAVPLVAMTGLLYLGYKGLAEFRSDGIRLLAGGIALDPAFFLFIQMTGALGLLTLGTWYMLCLKGSRLLGEIADLDAFIENTEREIEKLEAGARALEDQAATIRDDANGIARLRIDGIKRVGKAMAEAARAQAMSSALSAPVQFWPHFKGANAGLVTFSSNEETEAVRRRRGWLAVASGLTVIASGLVFGLLLGPLAGIAAGLATGAMIAFRAGVMPEVKGSLRRMARKDETRAIIVIGAASLAAGTASWALLGPLAGVAALATLAAALTFRAWGGSQAPDPVDPVIEEAEHSGVGMGPSPVDSTRLVSLDVTGLNGNGAAPDEVHAGKNDDNPNHP